MPRQLSFRSNGRCYAFCVATVAGFLLLAALAGNAEPRKKIIIDTDPGVDDALAILLALNSPELDVQALTVVPGNVRLRQGVENALKLVSLTDRCDVSVAADRKSTRLNSSHIQKSRMPSSA